MPSRSKSQQRLFAAAEHGAQFPLAQKLRTQMSLPKLREFAVGSMKNKPETVGHEVSNKVAVPKEQLTRSVGSEMRSRSGRVSPLGTPALRRPASFKVGRR